MHIPLHYLLHVETNNPKVRNRYIHLSVYLSLFEYIEAKSLAPLPIPTPPLSTSRVDILINPQNFQHTTSHQLQFKFQILSAAASAASVNAQSWPIPSFPFTYPLRILVLPLHPLHPPMPQPPMIPKMPMQVMTPQRKPSQSTLGIVTRPWS